MSRRALLIASLVLLVPGACYTKARLDDAALARAGYTPERGSPEDYFAARAKEGLTPAAVARRMPPPTQVERYVVPLAGGPDSALLERYIYRFGPGSFPVYIYYRRGGGVMDLYAHDVPGLGGARRISAAEAEQWRLWPQAVREESGR